MSNGTLNNVSARMTAVPDWLNQDAPSVARRLLGSELVREIDGQKVIVKIVETEAYTQTDAASHSFRGKTARTEVMFGPAGYVYVYFTYGMHYCMNVVCGSQGSGQAVLIRAVEPVQGQTILQQNRKGRNGPALTNGPAKLCQALAVDLTFNGHDLSCAPLKLRVCSELADSDIVQTTRVGIAQARDTPWRFYVRGNSYVSKLV